MDYNAKLKYHFKTKKGWINDPNGLVYFKGWYHLFYQHCPNYEHPNFEPMHWGHARTKDFLNWEELPIALYPDAPYDNEGCWSGTAIEKDGVLYLFYASIYTKLGHTQHTESVSIAYSEDGISFKKYEGNPVIKGFNEFGAHDFRDPAITCIDGVYYLVMATGNMEKTKARLLLYKSENLFDWQFSGIMSEWDNCIYAECPSFMPCGDKLLLACSVCKADWSHYFEIKYGHFENDVFVSDIVGEVDKGPDQYAGQIFRDHKGRTILMSWIPGWPYKNYKEKDVGCMSVPREIFLRDGKVCGWPVEEVRHLLKDNDPALKRTENGFEVEREGRWTIAYKGNINDLKIIRDEYIMEVFINGGEEIYSILL